MAKQNSSYHVPRDRPRKRPGRHKKTLNKSEKLNYKKYIGQGK